MSTFDPHNPQPGVYRDVPAAVYHAAKAVNASLLKALWLDCPLKAKALMDGDRDSTAAMEFGESCHAAVLEPKRFAAEYVVADSCDATTSKGTACTRNGTRLFDTKPGRAWLCEQHARSVRGDDDITPPNVVTAAELANLKGIRDRVWMPGSVSRRLLQAVAPGDTELTLVWDEADVRCKARLDAAILNRKPPIILDVKTAASAREHAFNAAIGQRGYHLQLAHYAAGLAACGLGDGAAGMILALEKTRPFVVEVYDVSGDMPDGLRHRDAGLDLYRQCRDADDWPSYGGGKVIPSRIPPYCTFDAISREAFAGE